MKEIPEDYTDPILEECYRMKEAFNAKFNSIEELSAYLKARTKRAQTTRGKVRLVLQAPRRIWRGCLKERISAMPKPPIFHPYTFGEQERKLLDSDGHFVLPGLLTSEAQEKLTNSLSHIHELSHTRKEGHEPNRFSAEYDSYLESLIAHPQMLELARKVLGEDIRYDHCVSLNRPGGNNGIGWHSHGYADDDPNLGFVRIFFYVNGFEPDDGGLKAVPGSHLYRDRKDSCTVRCGTARKLVNRENASRNG